MIGFDKPTSVFIIQVLFSSSASSPCPSSTRIGGQWDDDGSVDGSEGDNWLTSPSFFSQWLMMCILSWMCPICPPKYIDDTIIPSIYDQLCDSADSSR